MLLVVLQLLFCCTATCSAEGDSNSTTVLQILVLVPLDNYNMNEGRTDCLDLGEELIPAARIAAAGINENPDILAGYTLEILQDSTDPCFDPSIAQALGSFATFMNSTTQPGPTTVGLIGLVCPATLLAISHVASLPTVNILQISSSTTSPGLVTTSRQDDVGKLYQIAPSSTVFNEAVIALMQDRSWRNVSVIRHTDSISMEHDHIATDFRERITDTSEMLHATYAEVASGSARFVTTAKQSGVRIIYASVRPSEAQELLCEAKENGVIWPNYLWLFHSLSLQDVLPNTTEYCSLEKLQEAVEGVVLLQHDVSSEYNRVIDYVNYTYGEYYALYNEALENITSSPTCNQEPAILSANALHDSVLAFAYALDQSLPKTNVSCIGSSNCNATDTLASHLESANFSGAGGAISFDSSTHQLTANSRVNIYQVLNRTPSLIGTFNGLIAYKDVDGLDGINYTFERVVIRPPLALSAFILGVVGLFAVVTIVIFILFLRYRNSPDIKATSPILSYIILFACLLLYTSVALTTARYGFATGQTYANFCASERFLYAVGVQLIFATLFIRLLRVSRIFFNYEPVGASWSDQALCLYIGIMLLFTVLLMVLWLAIGNFNAEERVVFLSERSLPHFEIELRCVAKNQSVFLALLFSYTGLVMLMVTVLAIKTRKVTIDIFKDTKSVSVFVFCSVGILALFVPLSFITVNSPGTVALILSYVFHAFALLVVATACLCLLFIPKIYMALFPSEEPRSKSMTNRSSSCYGPSGTDNNFSLSKNSAYEQVKFSRP